MIVMTTMVTRNGLCTSMSVLQETTDAAVSSSDKKDEDGHAGEGPLAAPQLDKRWGQNSGEKLHAETMYVREYERGRVVRNTPIQRPEVIAMLSSLVGETQATTKRNMVSSCHTCSLPS
jgi:hypothetical protein